MKISAEDRARVEEAVRRAEARTGADFVCVLARNASTYRFYPLAWASILALGTPWMLLSLTLWPFADILLVQLAVFAVALPLLSLPPLRRLIVQRGLQRAAAHRAATEQFFVRDLATTPLRRGVLLFVAHEEHYARILADQGASEAVPPEHWRAAVDKLIAEARTGRHCAGFVAALDHCAEALSQSAPAERRAGGSLPNRFIVLD